MLILAIDTALDACAAAVLDTDTAKLVAQDSLPMKRGHAEALMPLIARVMQAAKLSFAALDRIAVTTGPGSFTGLRAGISAARGLALAAGKPAVGLTTLSAYAAAIVSQNRPEPVISAIAARHDHVYCQIVAGDGRQLLRPAVVEPANARDAARLAQLHGAAFARGGGEGEFEGMISERNTLVHRLRQGRKTIGFAVSRIGADEAEILSIAIVPSCRGRGLSRNLQMTHLGH